MMLPDLLPVSAIEERLKIIFPEGTPNHGYVTRQMAARTVFVLLYIGAIDGSNRWMSPKQIVLRSDAQASLQSDAERLQYAINSAQPRFVGPGQRWYADNTREPIRDETLREGLVRLGAVMVRSGLPTTSSKPRYALAADFAVLFDPSLAETSFLDETTRWQSARLGKATLARIQILQRGAVTQTEKVQVAFPNGEVRQLEAGPSSIIAQAVVEQFTHRFLGEPVVLWLSESGNKVVARDDALMQAIGLNVVADQLLPDIVLFDATASRELLVFVEVVATDGPMHEGRRQSLLALAQDADFSSSNVAFVTAYLDRSQPAFKKTVDSLAWQSFAWFVAEPDRIMILRHQHPSSQTLLSDLVQPD